MVLRRAVIAILSLLCAFDPAWGDTPSTAATLLHAYPGNHGFQHATGYHVPYGWSAAYRINPAGYFVNGLFNGGEKLSRGTYRYTFYFKVLPGTLNGLLKNANDVARVEAWDVTANKCLVSRTFQVADFPLHERVPAKTLFFSTWDCAGHRFEPRIYWPGLTGLFMRGVDLDRLEDISPPALKEKADTFEKAMSENFLDRGYVVARDLHGNPQDVGDAAIWTGLYAAAEAWRYEATQTPEALSRMEDSLRALHQLHAASPVRGTLVRYVYPDGNIYPDPASKDTYTGFFFAIANCLPWVRDPVLKQDLLNDVQVLADHFVDHDLSFNPSNGPPLDFNPTLTSKQVVGWFQELGAHRRQRRKVIRILETVNFYFLSHGQRPWPELSQMIYRLKRNDLSWAVRHFPDFLNGSRSALRRLQRNVARSAGQDPRWAGGPYGKLNSLLIHLLDRLPPKPIERPEDLHVQSSQALHALHFLKVMAETLPKPNRYQVYYEENLTQNKALLQTVRDWDNIDDELLSALLGDTRTATLRTSSAHLSFLALYDLMELERNKEVHADYQTLLEAQMGPQQAEFNAFLESIARKFNLPVGNPGIGLWSLMRYPVDRRGRGEAYWKREHQALIHRYGELGNQARDPLPLDERLRDCFIWQRSPRSLRGDNDQWTYPPMDYLFVYWMARANGQVEDH